MVLDGKTIIRDLRRSIKRKERNNLYYDFIYRLTAVIDLLGDVYHSNVVLRRVVAGKRMVNPACDKCKADVKPEHSQTKVAQTGCSAQYLLMTACMEQHGGNVSSCRIEWDSFRQCFQESRDEKSKKIA